MLTKLIPNTVYNPTHIVSTEHILSASTWVLTPDDIFQKILDATKQMVPIREVKTWYIVRDHIKARSPQYKIT